MLESFNKVAKHKCFLVNFVKFPDNSFLQTTLVAAAENLRDIFAQRIFSLQLKLCLHLLYFHSYSFATSMTKTSSRISFLVMIH